MTRRPDGATRFCSRVSSRDAERRKSLGSQGGKVSRGVSDPTEVFVTLKWESLDKARAFVDGLETREAMKWATSGIWSRVYIAEEVVEVEA